MHVGGHPLLAIPFDTQQVPFVVKTDKGGVPERWVPWWDGTSVRSATRDELIRLLSPLTTMPDFEVLGALAKIDKDTHVKVNNKLLPELHLYIRIYVTPLSSERLIFPHHRCSVALLDESNRQIVTADSVEFLVPPPVSRTLHASSSELLVGGPGLFEVKGTVGLESPLPKGFLLHTRINPSHLDRTAALTVRLEMTNPTTYLFKNELLGRAGVDESVGGVDY